MSTYYVLVPHGAPEPIPTTSSPRLIEGFFFLSSSFFFFFFFLSFLRLHLLHMEVPRLRVGSEL